MRGFIKSTLAVAAVAVTAWVFRNRLLAPAPLDEGSPPSFRTTPRRPSHTYDDTATEADDLTEIVGIGPVYRDRLSEAGIHTFSDLAEADVDVLAETLGTAVSQITDWTTQARERTS